MLVLKRDINQSVEIHYPGQPVVRVVVLERISRYGERGLRLGFEAPPEVKIYRSELAQRIKDEPFNPTKQTISELLQDAKELAVGSQDFDLAQAIRGVLVLMKQRGSANTAAPEGSTVTGPDKAPGS